MMTILLYEDIIKEVILPDSLLSTIEKLCDNSATLDLERAELLGKLLEDAKFNKISKRICIENFLSITKEIDKKLFENVEVNFSEHDISIENLMKLKIIENTMMIERFIQDLKNHAKEVTQIKKTFHLFLNQPSINIEALAVLFYLLEIKIIFLKDHLKVSATNEDFEFYTKVIGLLKPYVIPNKILLETYLNCKNNYSIKFNGDKYSLLKKDLESHMMLMNKCITKITHKVNTIDQLLCNDKQNLSENKKTVLLSNLHEKLYHLEEYVIYYMGKDPDRNKITQNIDFYRIGLDYSFLGFGFYYIIQAYYKKLVHASITIQQEIEHEIEETTILQLKKEAEEIIELNKEKTRSKVDDLKNRSIVESIISITPEILEEDYKFSVNSSVLRARVEDLNLKHLEFFNNIFHFNKKQNLKFSDLENAIVALGGKIKVHDGSKTWIYMPGGVLTGGFHKPHQDNIPLNFIQVNLIAKGLARSGITDEFIKMVLDRKENPKKLDHSSYHKFKPKFR